MSMPSFQMPSIKGFSSGLIPTMNKDQMGILQQLQQLASPSSFTSRLASGDQSYFQDLEAPALQQFNQMQANIANRFGTMGTMGGRHSSGFQLAQNQAAQ